MKARKRVLQNHSLPLRVSPLIIDPAHMRAHPCDGVKSGLLVVVYRLVVGWEILVLKQLSAVLTERH